MKTLNNIIMSICIAANSYSAEMTDEERRMLIEAGYLIDKVSVKMSEIKIENYSDTIIYYNEKSEYVSSFYFETGIDWTIYYKINADKTLLDAIKSQGEFSIYKNKFVHSGPKWWKCEPNGTSIVSNSIIRKGNFNYVVLDYENNVVYQYCGTN